MPNRFLRALLFLSSYAPVFLILALKSHGDSFALFRLSVALLIGAVIGILIFWGIAKRHNPQEMVVLTVQSRDADLAGYLVGYLLPFVGAVAVDWQDVLAFILFFVFVGIIYVNSRMIYVNPLLALAGYHLYEVQATTDLKKRDATYLTPQFLVSKREWLRREDEVVVRRVMADALIEFPKDGPPSDSK